MKCLCGHPLHKGDAAEFACRLTERMVKRAKVTGTSADGKNAVIELTFTQADVDEVLVEMGVSPINGQRFGE